MCRVFVGHSDRHSVDGGELRVKEMLRQEDIARLNCHETYLAWDARIQSTKTELMALLAGEPLS